MDDESLEDAPRLRLLGAAEPRVLIDMMCAAAPNQAAPLQAIRL